MLSLMMISGSFCVPYDFTIPIKEKKINQQTLPGSKFVYFTIRTGGKKKKTRFENSRTVIQQTIFWKRLIKLLGLSGSAILKRAYVAGQSFSNTIEVDKRNQTSTPSIFFYF